MKLGQVMLFVKDLPRMQAFYRDVLELVPLDEDPQFSRYDAGGVTFALHPLPPDVAASIEEPPRRRSDTAIKYTFHVDDLPAAIAKLAAAGVKMSEARTFGPRTFCDGMDPEGNVFQIANH